MPIAEQRQYNCNTMTMMTMTTSAITSAIARNESKPYAKFDEPPMPRCINSSSAVTGWLRQLGAWPVVRDVLLLRFRHWRILW